MSMSKKHYEAVAKILRDIRDETERGASEHRDLIPALLTLDTVARRLGEWFAADNDRFDLGRFEKAAAAGDWPPA
jgi:hypothetical protein